MACVRCYDTGTVPYNGRSVPCPSCGEVHPDAIARVKDADRDHIVEEIMEAQADLQTAIGFHRLWLKGKKDHDYTIIERRMEASLDRLHKLLADHGVHMAP
jgi:hypothetical protein